VKVKLSDADSHAATVLAQDVVRMKELQGIPTKEMNLSRIDSNVLGFMAEFAVARVLGCEPPRLTFVNDGGIDLWVDDVSIDVKVSKEPTGNLIFDDTEKFRAKVAVFVSSLGDNQFQIHGWISRQAFINSCNYRDFGYGERVFVSCDKLNSMGSLWEKITERKMS
jgi:hypothetical protein